METYGTLDELNAALSLCARVMQGEENRQLIDAVQHQLFYFSAELASEGIEVPPVGRKSISEQDIHALEQAVDAAMTLGIAVVVALTDRHGNLIMTYRMPDTLLVSSELAPKKAWTTVALKTATHQLSSAVQPGADLFQLEASTGGKVVSFGGGYPLWRDGQLVGGLGISGGSVEQDMHIAEAAISALHLRNE